MALVCATGNTLEVRIVDPTTHRGVPGVTCRAFEAETVVISGGTLTQGSAITSFGAGQTSGLVDTFDVSGTTDADGVATLYDIGPYDICIVISGTGFMTQIAKGYERIEMPRTFKLYEFSYGELWGGEVLYIEKVNSALRSFLWITSAGVVQTGVSVPQSPI